MAKNVGSADRAIRIVIGLALGFMLWLGIIHGVTAIVVGVIAAIFLLTGVIGLCPFYKMLDVDTTEQLQSYSTTDDRSGL